MDAGRIWLVSTIASVSLALAFATPQSSYGAGQSGWSGGAPAPTVPSYTTPTNTAPTYAAPSYDRYGAPVNNGLPVYGQPTTISQRTQNAVSETGTALSDGFNATVRATKDGAQAVGQQFQEWGGAASQQVQTAGGTIRSATEQTVGTSTNNQARFSNPFATPAPAATTTSTARTQPPPWPTAATVPTTTTAATPAQTWTNTTSTATATLPTGDWSSIGSTIASPPMLVPQLPPSNDATGSFSPIATTASRNGPTFPADKSAGQDNTHSVLAPPSQPNTTSRSAADDWTWGNTADASRATIDRGGNTPTRTEPNRDFNVTPSQTIAAAPQDTKKTTPAKSNDLWADDPWTKPSPSSPGASGAVATIAAPTISATASKPSPVATNNSSPFNAAPAGSPALNAPTVGATSNTVGFPNSTAPALPAANPTITTKTNSPAAPATGEQQPWMLMVAAVLGLAGSLAANFFLGWSYLDARQKYQSLVRRTADTFRRTKSAAA